VIDPNFWGPSARPAFSDPLLLFFSLRNFGLGWLIGHAVVGEVSTAIRFRVLGETGITVDLLDTAPLAAFARRGLRSAFVWILCSSLVSLFWLGPAAGSANAVIVGLVLVMVSAGFWISIDGARLAVQAAKRERLAELNAQIRREAAASGASGEAVSESARLANLIAYRGLVEGVRDWPIGAPTIARLGLVALLAASSWLGGALFERLVDSLLD
jgi:hypothetical protein